MRKGRIELSRYYLDNPEEAHEIMGELQLIPFKAEYLWDRQIVEIYGISPMFDDVGMEYESPTYILMIEEDGEGNYKSFYVERV